MAKVVKLQQPKSATVELAETLLAECKSGEILAFAVAKVIRSPSVTASASAFADPKATAFDHKVLRAAIEEMRHEFEHAQRGG